MHTSKAIRSVIEGRSIWTIKQGDCLNEMRCVPSHIADLVLCDPPYGVKYRGWEGNKKPIANDDHPFIWWLYDARRILKVGGSLICFCNWRLAERWKLAIEMAGFVVRSQVIWDKGKHGMGDTAATFGPRYEVAWFATNGRFSFPAGRPVDVLQVPMVPPAKRLHSTEKPLAVLEYLIDHLTRPGDLVVDPTCGSGSAGEAAVKLRRRFIGFELDAVNAGNATRRLAAVATSSQPRIKPCFARPAHGYFPRRAVA